jgi:hypothetical protein
MALSPDLSVTITGEREQEKTTPTAKAAPEAPLFPINAEVFC